MPRDTRLRYPTRLASRASSGSASGLLSSRGHQSKGSDTEYGKSPQSGNRQDQRGDQRRQRRRQIYLSRVRQDLHSRGFLGSTSQPRPRSGRCLNSRSAHSRTPRPPQRRFDDSARSGHPDDAAAEHSCTRPGQLLGRLAQWHKPRRTSAVHLPERSSGPGRGDPAGKCLAGRSRAACPLQVAPYVPAVDREGWGRAWLSVEALPPSAGTRRG